jgi:serine/threonine protein kinase/tetratricopeptide (TPR) repeat protein
MPEYWQQVEEIFHQALEMPLDARAAFLSERCAGDRLLQSEVQQILAGYEAQDRIDRARANETDKGSRFGAFEIVSKIGEGGMGAVYLARRHEDFEQSAAIKLINGSAAAAALMVGRFQRERQILAGLDHPNIARLLDGGVSGRGQPYLVMEYVEGVRLDQYCEARHLTIPERLELFRKICAAVHFAHQHLVIHRDLKPGNILVNEAGEPKLLDFGIAKVLAEPGNPDQTMTMTGALMMTPQYASPEQIQGLSCTVASDVYSLGVILYEMLAGTGPYSSTASTPAEFIAAVVTKEAPRPSVVASELLKAPLRGDLDGIVMKALAKKPGDRYGSVEQFSEDVRRHLEGLPVSAVEGTRIYIARKFVRRHRLGVTAAALILLSLIGGLAGTLWQARVAYRERALAEQRFSDARKLANYLLFPLYDSVQSLPGSLPVRADMAGQSLQYLDRLASAKSNDRALRLELAEGYIRLGTILEGPVGVTESLGDTGKALESDQKAIALLDQERQKDERVQKDLARADVALGSVLNLRGKPDEGVAKLTEGAAIFDVLVASHPHDLETLVDAGRAYLALGDAVSGRGGGFVEVATHDRVMRAAEKAIADFRAALETSAADHRALLGLAQAYNLKATTEAAKNVAQALPTYRLGLDALHQIAPDLRSAPANQAFEARLLTMIGFCQEETGLYAEAIATLAPAQEILDRLAAADPKNATNALRRVNLYRTRAFANQYAGHTKEAIADYRQTIGILDGMIATDPAKLSNRLVRAELQQKLAQMLVKDGQIAEAEQITKSSLQFWTEVAERPDAAPQNLKEAASAFIAGAIPSLLDYRRALGYAQRADQLANGKDFGAIFYIAQCYEQLGDGPKALEAVERGLATLPPLATGEKPSRNRLLMEKHQRRIQVLIKTGRLPKDE